MKLLCEIGAKISRINIKEIDNYETIYIEKVFEILYPYATEYRKLDCDYGLLPEYCRFHADKKIKATQISISLEEAIKKMSEHPFVTWLNGQPGFVTAKKKIDKEKLIVLSNPGIEIIKQHRNSFALEYICSLVIHYFTNDKNKLTQVVVTKKKLKPIETAIKKLRYELRKGGGIYFREESKQHLLQIILEERINDFSKNVYNSEKNHPYVIRQFLTKKIIQCLFTIYSIQDISHTLVVDVALDITSLFFHNLMDRSDAVIEAKEILNNLAEDNKFRQQTIGNILSKKGLELMEF